MAGDSLANTLSFLQSQITGNRDIPAASPEFLASARNPNIRNFGPGQQPEFQSPILQMLMSAPGRGASSLADSLAGVGVSQGNEVQPAGSINNIRPPQGDQGFLTQIMRSLGFGDAANPLLGRQSKIDDIVNQ